MNILIDENLRKLRLSRGNRQEDLAAHLGVSAQSVSKWERGENLPDLTLIPAIASYYDVTVDDLLGVGEERKRERLLLYYEKKHLELLNKGKTAEDVALWREAKKEYPNEHMVLTRLAYAIFTHEGARKSDDKDRFNEAISLAERVLSESTEQDFRDSALQTLCLSYNFIGNYEMAKKYANMGCWMGGTKDLLLLQIKRDDDPKGELAKNFICKLTHLFNSALYAANDIDWLKRTEFHIKLMELVYDDGFCGFYAYAAAEDHILCARLYAEKGKGEKARYHLEKCMEFSKQFDNLPEHYTYHSTVLNGLEGDNSYITASEDTECERLLEFLNSDNSHMFDPWRDTDWYIAVLEDLKASVKKD